MERTTKQSLSLGLWLLVGTVIVSQSPIAMAKTILPQVDLPMIQQVEMAQKMGNPQAIERSLRMVLARYPDDTLTLIKLADLLNQQGRWNESISLYKKAGSIDPADPMILFNLAAIYEQIQNYPEAELAYRQGLQKNPQFQFGLLGLARTLTQQNKSPEAIQTYKAFLQAYPKHFEARRYLAYLLLASGQAAPAVQEFDTLKADYPYHFKDELVYARALNQANFPDRALPILANLTTKEGETPDILQEMGNAYLLKNQTGLARDQYKKAFTLDPKHAALALKVADLSVSLQETDEAIQFYQAYLSSDPNHLEARHGLGMTYLKTQQYTDAIEQFQFILSHLTGETAERYQQEYFLKKQIAYAEQLQGHLPLAINGYEQLLQSAQYSRWAQEDWSMQNNLAIAYHQNQQLPQALQQYEKVLAAMMRAVQDPNTKPSEDLAKLIQHRAVIEHDVVGILLSMGDQAYQANHFTAAEEAYQKATQYSEASHNPQPYVGLGNVAFTQNAFDKAREYYQAALLRDPENATAKLYLAKLPMAEAAFRTNAAMNQTNHQTASSQGSSQTGAAASLQVNPQVNPNANTMAQALAMRPNAVDLKAEETLQTLIQLAESNPNYLEAQVSLAEEYQKRGQKQEAARYYAKAVALAPKDVSLQLAYGGNLQQLGQLAEAQRIYQGLVANQPNHTVAHYNLATVYQQQAQLDAAQKEYQQVLMLDNTMAEAHYGLATVFEAKEKPLDALAQYQAYIQKRPQGNYIQEAQNRVRFLLKRATSP